MLSKSRIIRTGDKFSTRDLGNIIILYLKNTSSSRIIESKVSDVNVALVLYDGVTIEIKVSDLEDHRV